MNHVPVIRAKTLTGRLFEVVLQTDKQTKIIKLSL